MADTTRKQILSNIESSKQNIKFKKRQILGATKRTRFKGVRIQDQFAVGIRGIKPFRERKIIEKRQAFSDLGIFNTQLSGFNTQLNIDERALIDFDSGVGL